MDYLEENNLVNSNQSGFKPNDSCESQLLSIVHDIYSSFDYHPSLEVRAGIFSSTFLLPVNGSKNSILNWVFKLNLFFIYCFFKNTSYQNLWNYEITKPTICFQNRLCLVMSSLALCLDPLRLPRFIGFHLEPTFFLHLLDYSFVLIKYHSRQMS